MGLLSRPAPRIVKPVEVDPEIGIIGTYPYEVRSHRMHGRDYKWDGAVAKGNLRRMSQEPKPRPWSRNPRRP